MKPNNIFNSYLANNDKLRKYIAYYYFHSSEIDDFEYSFSYYPNYKNALTVYKNSKIHLSPTNTIVQPSQNKPTSIYSFNTKYKSNLTIYGKFDKIGVVFQALGINNFLPKSLNNYFSGDMQFFNAFGLNYENVCLNVFQQQHFEQKIQLLDNYFLTQLQEFQQPKIEQAIEIILHTKGTISIQELANTLATSRKTLLRLFQQHLCCTIKEYCKIVKFRNAIELYTKESPSLTELAYKAFYYDQAHFIHQFKDLTEESPKQLLQHLKEMNQFGFFVKEE